MLNRDQLKEVLSNKGLSQRDKLLICLAVDPVTTHKVEDVRTLAVKAGQRSARDWNISAALAKAPTLVIRTDMGWELTAAGKKHVAAICGPILPGAITGAVSGLRKHLRSINDDGTKSFLEEAVGALEAKLYRAAIVFSWVGAVSVLYEHVVNSHLPAFNAEAAKRDTKWRMAKTADDLARMKEHEFLQVLVAISVIGKNVKDELEACLKSRNGCGHPNTLTVGEHKAAAHVETLIQNVFSKL